MINRFNKAIKYYFEDKDYNKAYNSFYKLAKEGYLDAQEMIADMLLSGTGVEKNIEESGYWYKQAALQGNLNSMHQYAFFCLDYNRKEEADIFFKKMIEQNYLPAIYNIASFYHEGNFGYSVDKKEALLLYKKGCKLKDFKSCIQAYGIIKELNGQKKATKFLSEEVGLWRFFKIFILSRFQKIKNKFS